MQQTQKLVITLWLTLLVGASFAPSAGAALRIVEDAYELTKAQILRWPLGSGDRLVFRRCGDCATETLKLTERTTFAGSFDGTEIALDEMLRRKTSLRSGDGHVITVFFSPETREITRLVLQTEN